MQAENDELKAQEIEDRKRITHLLALTEPMTQEVRMETRLRYVMCCGMVWCCIVYLLNTPFPPPPPLNPIVYLFSFYSTKRS